MWETRCGRPSATSLGEFDATIAGADGEKAAAAAGKGRQTVRVCWDMLGLSRMKFLGHFYLEIAQKLSGQRVSKQDILVELGALNGIPFSSICSIIFGQKRIWVSRMRRPHDNWKLVWFHERNVHILLFSCFVEGTGSPDPLRFMERDMDFQNIPKLFPLTYLC